MEPANASHPRLYAKSTNASNLFCRSVTPNLSTNASYSAKSRLSCPFRFALRHLVATLHANRMSVAYRPHRPPGTCKPCHGNPRTSLSPQSMCCSLSYLHFFCLTLPSPPVRDARRTNMFFMVLYLSLTGGAACLPFYFFSLSFASCRSCSTRSMMGFQ